MSIPFSGDPSDETLRVLVVDHQPLFRRGLAMLLDAEPDISVVGEAGDGRAAVELATQLLPDVVVMEVRMPGMSGLETCGRIKEAAPSSQVLMLTVSDEEHDLSTRPSRPGRRAICSRTCPRTTSPTPFGWWRAASPCSAR